MENRENLRVRKQTVEVKGILIEFEEYYKVDPITEEEVFDRELEIENDSRLYDVYKKQKGLLTTQEIKSIRRKYGMTQKEFAISIGVGEITVHRFENGAIQTESVDAVMRLSDDPDNMCNLLIKNHINLTEDSYQIFMKKVNELQRLKRHCIAKYNLNDFVDLDVQTVDADIVSSCLIKKYNSQYDLLSQKYGIDANMNSEYITPLKLQKLLYYIQGLSLHIFGKPAFNNKIFAWGYGPVVSEIYQKYKDNGRSPIIAAECDSSLSDGLNKIIDVVIESYGQIESGKLIDLTHDEEPWYSTTKDFEITVEKIKDYFNKVYDN
jgi:putative zinc finger/helix-turn-helix YgiT family protein